MIRAATLLALTTSALALAQTPEPLDPRCDKVLPVSAAEKATGLSPLKVVGRFQVKYAGGNCNYVNKSEKLVFLVTLESESQPDNRAKLFARTKGGSAMGGALSPVPGVGEEAFANNDALVFRKGDFVVTLGRFLDLATGKPLLSDAARLEVAKALAAKL
jgi:hypothetical protein